MTDLKKLHESYGKYLMRVSELYRDVFHIDNAQLERYVDKEIRERFRHCTAEEREDLLYFIKNISIDKPCNTISRREILIDEFERLHLDLCGDDLIKGKD
jgi:hypothetical protein